MSATPHTLRELDDRVREVLGRRELVSADEVRKARLRQRTDDRSLGELLVESGALDPCDLRTILSEMLDLPAVDLRHTPCDPTALDVLPAAKAWELGAIPLFVVEGEATVAISDPTDLAALDELRFATGKKILPVLALESDIQDHLRAYYGDRAEDDADLLEFVQADGSSVDDTVALDHVEVDRPVVRVVSLILVRAIQEEASDIHFEPQDGGMTVRFRLDGRLQPKPFRIPASAIGSIVSRIKILSSLDISEKRRPQDGKIRLTYRGRKIDVRTSTCPTLYGEKVVLRLLDKERLDFRLGSIGMAEPVLQRWRDLLRRGQGIVLVTGPTGSGKSSTLFATLRHLNEPDVNIATLEDPVEYELRGVSQSQVNARAGFTFASGLRSLLRQDPDIILVGEIRDVETAQIAVQAALTGHLVLATLHTNDAPSAITRLVDMGLPRYLVGGSLVGVLAQRLARRSCPECTGPVEPDAEERRQFATWLDDDVPFAEGTGCDRCHGSGYRGRIGVQELLVLDRRMQRIVAEGGSEQELAEAGERHGYRRLVLDALDKVRTGHTTIRELARSVGLEQDDKPVSQTATTDHPEPADS